MKKDKNLSRQEVEYKQKSGTAWSHSYLNQKPWHPLSYPNQRRKWIAEQTHAQREQQVADVAREFAQEQEFFRQTAQMTKKEKEKMEQLQAVSFMYIRPPGYNAEAARAAEIADERKKLGLTTSSSGAPDQGAAQGNASTSGKEGAKARVKDVFGRTLPTEEEFPALKNAPRLETGAPVRLKPFAIEIRNVMCARCGAFGHQSGDRECSLKDILMPNEEDRLKREDPLNVILAQTASGEPLKWELKQQPGGLSPARGGFRPDDPNQQIIPDEDIYDEYGGFLAGEGEDEGLSIPNVLASLSKEQRRELTDPNIDVKDKKRPKKKKKKKHRHGEKHDNSDEGQIRQSNRDRRRSAKHEHDLKAEPPSPLRSEDEENGMNHSNGEEQRRRHREKRRRAIRGSRRRKEESSPESDYEKKVHSSDDEDQRRKMRRDKKSVSKTDGARKRERTSDGSGDEQRRHGTHADQRGRRRRTRKHSNRSDSDNKREVYSDSSDYSPSSDEYQRRKRHLRKRRAGKREDRRKTKAFSDESDEDEDLGRKKHRDMSRVDRSDGSLKVKLSPDDGEEDQRRKFKYSDRKKLRKGDPRKTVRNERGGRKDGSSGESDDDQGMSSSDEEKRRQRRRERKMSRIESRNKR
ncbi:CBF1 interacting corepressor [Marchantia polymorpha subsp. ruderalis]|uniref:CBF1-interacting co-repressor CIR N-terminal domain-containing protein n=2 Tax=Marchantia polymorpha TaxID=3197 RepID=A0AAF6BKA8_MARPO|nr:hypothetical protein MARPO_0190s0006 [Marchantia polymorpha]BBN12442.1 hypothetical protein Mp_5g20100 [Marchantia polymorpha subsp. ruderalis]|eukprot:PTQ27609.1 hypothetical protein MARPO_0190s0006 [Marchantia polymorpha]